MVSASTDETATTDHNVTQLFGRDIFAGSSRQQKKWIDQALNYWRAHGFPYPSLSKEDIDLEFRRLAGVGTETVLRKNDLHPSTVGLRLANTFQPQIWSVPARNHRLAPIDHFND